MLFVCLFVVRCLIIRARAGCNENRRYDASVYVQVYTLNVPFETLNYYYFSSRFGNGGLKFIFVQFTGLLFYYYTY